MNTETSTSNFAGHTPDWYLESDGYTFPDTVPDAEADSLLALAHDLCALALVLAAEREAASVAEAGGTNDLRPAGAALWPQGIKLPSCLAGRFDLQRACRVV